LLLKNIQLMKKYLLFITLCLLPNILYAQEVLYDLKADKACFDTMYRESLTGEELTVEEFKNVWPICIKAAESGAAGSQYLVGMVYLEQDREKAIYWLKKAAEQGYTDAMEQLNKMFSTE